MGNVAERKIGSAFEGANERLTLLDKLSGIIDRVYPPVTEDPPIMPLDPNTEKAIFDLQMALYDVQLRLAKISKISRNPEQVTANKSVCDAMQELSKDVEHDISRRNEIANLLYTKESTPTMKSLIALQIGVAASKIAITDDEAYDTLTSPLEKLSVTIRDLKMIAESELDTDRLQITNDVLSAFGEHLYEFRTAVLDLKEKDIKTTADMKQLQDFTERFLPAFRLSLPSLLQTRIIMDSAASNDPNIKQLPTRDAG